jgi:hypothetical protein
MKIFFLLMIIAGVASASYGFSAAIDPKASRPLLRSILFLGGIICMGLGILLYHVPHFFSSMPQ